MTKFSESNPVKMIITPRSFQHGRNYKKFPVCSGYKEPIEGIWGSQEERT